MAQGCKRTLMLGMISAVVLLAMAASHAHAEVQQQCSIKELMPCLNTVKGPYPPRPDGNCCSVVMTANPNCLCSQFVNSNFPQNLIKNVLAMPKACGRTQLSGFHCGIYTIE